MSKLTIDDIISKGIAKSERAVRWHIQNGILPEPTIEDGTWYFEKESIAKQIGVKSLNEPFINIWEASRVLKFSRAKVAKYCRTNLLPYYFFPRPGGGFKYLFRKSEIERAVHNDIYKWNETYVHKSKTINFIREIFQRLLSNEAFIQNLKQQEIEVLQAVLVKGKSGKETLQSIDNALIVEDIKSNFLSAMRKFLKQMDINNSAIYQMVEANQKLREENTHVRKLTSESKKIPSAPRPAKPSKALLEIPVENLGLRNPVVKHLKAANILTLGNLIKCSEKKLLRIKHIGIKSLHEIKRQLAEKSIDLARR